GCGQSRPPRTQADLLAIRQRNDQQYRAETERIMAAMLKRVDAEYSATARGATTGAAPPVLNILIISGGGDWGAFGAGFLKGWAKVTGPTARPVFDVVTGVSTGALIAPFAYLGDDESIERIVHLYRNPKKDWVKQRWPLFFLPSNISFAEVPGLEREVRVAADDQMIRRIAEQA